MTQHDRLRRTGILCCHCLRNIAFYRSWYKAGKPFLGDQFWVNVNGNFLDIAVLEWCKLFGDTKSNHHYDKVVADPTAFKQDLLAAVGLTAAEFATYIKAMRAYRDKFVAHLDDQPTMHIPNLSVAKKSTKLLYESLLAQEAGTDTFHGAPTSGSKFYRHFLAQGQAAYKRRAAA